MNDTLETKIDQTSRLNNLYEVNFFHLINPADSARLDALLAEKPHTTVFDSVAMQLEELIKTRNPGTKLSSDDLAERLKDHLGSVSQRDYGVWVHYPWSDRLVHLLDQAEFAELRTNRNVYKITVEEQQILARRKVGIIGLSVGQSVALTLAMERGFGELRIADFDRIDLSNLNRIRAGVHNIGVPKVIAVAREIAEIDPYLQVKCFADGLNEENFDEFFLSGGSLDLLIDECDSLDIKVLARQRARELKIPVLMETSDRGMLDVERFDLEPERPILHGLVEHVDTENLKGLSNEEKVSYSLSIVDIDTTSERMRASLLEVGQTISTWPQLASDVVLGGATTANVSRRIALDQFRASGRFYVDIDAIVSDNSPDMSGLAAAEPDKLSAAEPLESVVAASVTHSVLDHQIDVKSSIVTQLIEAAAMAPSGGNVQPWRWRYAGKNLYLYLDPARAHSYLDYQQTGSYLALGAAAENLVLKAHELGFEVGLDLFPSAADRDLVAVIHFFEFGKTGSHVVEPHICDELVSSIPERLTNRNVSRPQHPPEPKLKQLSAMAETIDSAHLHLFTDDPSLDQIGELIGIADRLLLTDKNGHQGFVSEVRWTAAEAERTRDGVDLATIELSPGEIAGLKVARSWQVVKHLAKWGGGSVFEKLSRKSMAGASAVGLLTMPEYSPKSYFDAGRAVQRVWLRANELGICLQPMTAVAFLFARLIHGGAEEMAPELREGLAKLREPYSRVCRVDGRRQDVFLFRLFEAGPPKVRALRHPVEEILTIE